MNQHRYQLERYRGRGSRYVCPKCRHKHSFTRYIDTYNNNIYINDSVGKCNRLDKCGYHYTPRQYFDDNPHLRDTDTYLHPWTPVTNIGKMTKCPVSNPHFDTIPEWIVEGSLRRIDLFYPWDSTYLSTTNFLSEVVRCGLISAHWFLVRVVQMCCIAKEDPLGIVLWRTARGVLLLLMCRRLRLITRNDFWF